MLVRTPDLERRDYITRVKQLPQKHVQMQFMWDKSDAERKTDVGFKKYPLEVIEKVLSTPEYVNAFLSGPITNRKYICAVHPSYPRPPRHSNEPPFQLYNTYLKVKMFDDVLSFQHGVNINKWIGINSYTNNIIRRLDPTGRGGLGSDTDLVRELSKKVFESIAESLNEYEKNPSKAKPLGEIVEFTTPQRIWKHMQHIQSQIDNCYNIIKTNLICYLQGRELITPYKQLMVLNDSFSKNIETVLRTRTKMGNREIFMTLSSFSPNKAKITNNVLGKLMERLSIKLIFEFATGGDLGVSITQHIREDQFMGALGTVMSERTSVYSHRLWWVCESLPMLAAYTFGLEQNHMLEDEQRDFVEAFIMYLEVDCYLGKHVEFVKLMREVSCEKLFNHPF